jgi:hypothetical protein
MKLVQLRTGVATEVAINPDYVVEVISDRNDPNYSFIIFSTAKEKLHVLEPFEKVCKILQAGG